MTALQNNRTNALWRGVFIFVLALFGQMQIHAATLTSIGVSPSDAMIQIGQTQAYSATGTFSDMSTRVLGGSATAIAAGGVHACAVVSGGQVKCWGNNSHGQLGDNSTTSAFTPVTVSGLSGAMAVTAGDYHTCALIASGQVKCWGYNGHGQLGYGTNDAHAPVSVSGLSGATAIAAAGDYTCALVAGGQVKCWGDNSFGQLGNNSTNDAYSPVTVSGLSGVTVITAGGDHTCALVAGGQVKCWGFNSSGQLGNNSNIDSLTPVTVSGLSGATAIAASDYTNIGSNAGNDDYTCAVISGGLVQCWGQNQDASLSSYTPVTVAGLSSATAISAKNGHTCALITGGQVQCWGYNSDGLLGDISITTFTSSTPGTVTGLSGATAIAAGGYNTCVLVTGGQVQCWGAGAVLGIQSTSKALTPMMVSSLSGATAIAAGGHPFGSHTCALVSGGQVQCWGNNDYGQLGGNSTLLYSSLPLTVSGLSSVMAIAPGGDHTCALVAGGQVQCWGGNLYGQLGIGTTSGPDTCGGILGCSTTPVTVSGLSGVTAIAGVRTLVRSWGINNTTLPQLP